MDHLVDDFKRAIRGGGRITKEHRDYELCKLFGCSPASLDEVEESLLTLYWEFSQEEVKHTELQANRQAQKAKFTSKMK